MKRVDPIAIASETNARTVKIQYPLGILEVAADKALNSFDDWGTAIVLTLETTVVPAWVIDDTLVVDEDEGERVALEFAPEPVATEGKPEFKV